MAEPTLTRDGEIFIINYGTDDNVTSAAWAASMNVLLDQVESAAGPKVLVTTGSGKHYSNGLDVPFMATANPDQLRAYLYRSSEWSCLRYGCVSRDRSRPIGDAQRPRVRVLS
jgi:enoyl-CoA hydratase/carnithine racemase